MKGGAVLDKQKDIRFSLWKKRHTLPVIEKRKSITLLVLIIAASALLPGGAFGTFYMVVAGALLALLLTADRSLLWLVSIPGVGIIAFLTHVLFASEGTSVLWILSAFLYIPPRGRCYPVGSAASGTHRYAFFHRTPGRKRRSVCIHGKRNSGNHSVRSDAASCDRNFDLSAFCIPVR